MSTKSEIEALKAKITAWGKGLSQSEQSLLQGLLNRATQDALDDRELENVTGGLRSGWAQIGAVEGA